MTIGTSALTAVSAIAITTALSAQVPPPKPSRLTRLLRIAGLTAAPSQMRGPAEEVATGSIWIVSIDRRAACAVTSDGGYRSPVFSPDGTTILALRDDTIVRIPSEGGRGVRLHAAAGVSKLVGFDSASRDELVVLLSGSAAGSPLGVLSLHSGKITPLPYDSSTDDERRVLAQIRAQDRVYGDTSVYTKTEIKQGLSRTIEWTDVYVKRGSAAAQNISACDGTNCVQPALSPDGRSIIFVKAE